RQPHPDPPHQQHHRPAQIRIALANRSIVNPAGVLEDVLVRVDKLIFPADFYILDMKDDEGMRWTTVALHG
ncbi:hypothetical protein KC218_25890, partial [Mycobacterium tuberculosis]|nr:hypothetical protein [Mycobacterium tuberculosis]